MAEVPGLFVGVRALIISGFSGFTKVSAGIIQSNISSAGGQAELLGARPRSLEAFSHVIIPAEADEKKLASVLGTSSEELANLPLVKLDWAVDTVRLGAAQEVEKYRWKRKVTPPPPPVVKKVKMEEEAAAPSLPPREECPAFQQTPPQSPKRESSPVVKEEGDCPTLEEIMLRVKREQGEGEAVGFWERSKSLSSVPEERQQFWESQKHRFEFAQDSTSRNLNAHITKPLEALMQNYRVLGDKGRYFAYQDAISRLNAFPKRITSIDDLRGQFRFGEKMIAKIREILSTGSLQRLECMDNNFKHLKPLKELTSIWGVGRTLANRLYIMGYRTVADLKARPCSLLNRAQSIGLELYDEFATKMPRAEAKTICDRIEAAAKALAAPREVTVVPCGSYRRGREFCSDLDILMTFEDIGPSEGFINHLIRVLTDSGLVTHQLQISEHWNPTEKHSHHMFAGVVRLPEGKHRRLDIKIYPRETFAWALMHFTGSANFNRSIRLFAKNKGYKLTDGGLYPAIRVDGRVMHGDTSAVCHSEEEIFKIFGIKYKTPQERDI